MRDWFFSPQGSLFSRYFLTDTITATKEWHALDDAAVDAVATTLRKIIDTFPRDGNPNETQTEDDVIWAVLKAIGWDAVLRQQRLSPKGRDDVPDGLLFADADTKAKANGLSEWERYSLGLALVESKRWGRPLDRRSDGGNDDTGTPSSQMLRYLRRAEDVTKGALRWGVLTNGQQWRLYWGGARSVSEEFFELDLDRILGLAPDLLHMSDKERHHWMKVFILIFRPGGFLPALDGRSFHQQALDEGRNYEQRITENLAQQVFDHVFPNLVQALMMADPSVPASEIRTAALIFLYRILFILYAEDRDLLPVRSEKYDDYSLRKKVRHDVGARMDKNDTFSRTISNYWSIISNLSRAIDRGDVSLGLPPYNGGLFDQNRVPLLARLSLGDDVLARIIDILSFEQTETGRKYINYRDLSVQHLGSVYERLLEHEVFRDGDAATIRLNATARKGSGSYYTPDDLVLLTIRNTAHPFVDEAWAAFEKEAGQQNTRDSTYKIPALQKIDPAERLLSLKICDPAMGSGHFLVALVDYLADEVIALIARSETEVEGYHSPLSTRIAAIRGHIQKQAEQNGWTVDKDHLDDRHIIRRMVLKRCVYGVDKNSMAVELAKVSLWLHTFTVGAPLSFLDHHIRCGDSLFGAWVHQASDHGGGLFLFEAVKNAIDAARPMQIIEDLSDADIAEAKRSAQEFSDHVTPRIEPLNRFLSLFHALQWLRQGKKDKVRDAAIETYLDGGFGNPLSIALGDKPKSGKGNDADLKNGLNKKDIFNQFQTLLEQARILVEEEQFLNWQVTFPGVWTTWESRELHGGFDMVVGNPPWERIKLQDIEWFSQRDPAIAKAQTAAARKKMIPKTDPELKAAYGKAVMRAETAMTMARNGGDYPQMSAGDINLYSLFVERALALIKPTGMVGLITPSGIGSDKTSAPFFRRLSENTHIRCFYDFENKKTFFPDVHASFKFSVLVYAKQRHFDRMDYGVFLHSTKDVDQPDRCFPMRAEDFIRVNPNTGTAPIFRSRRDMDLTVGVYDCLPVLVRHSKDGEQRAWPVKYLRMFDMANDSHLFRSEQQLQTEEGAYPVDDPVRGRCWKKRINGVDHYWRPLYEGKMVQAYDHRAASVVVNADNLFRPGQPLPATLAQHQDQNWQPTSQHWIPEANMGIATDLPWLLVFKDITATTNMRTMIASAIPHCGAGHTLPALMREQNMPLFLLLGNLNSTIFDYVSRQKVQSNHLTWFIIEQLPVVPLETYDSHKFGDKTAAEVVRDAVLELTYTAHDMAGFARDLGYVNDDGTVRPPFCWDEDRRLNLKAKLDAVYFILYGITDPADVDYIYSTFPIVKRQEEEVDKTYRTPDLCKRWINALQAGDPDAPIR